MTRTGSTDDESTLGELVLAELSKDARALFAKVSAIECGCVLVRFLHAHAKTLRTADDMAYRLAQPHAEVERGIHALVDLGLVQKVHVSKLVLFGITQDKKKLLLVSELCDWEKRWHARMAQITCLLDGKDAD